MGILVEDRWVDNWARMCLEVQSSHGKEEVNRRCSILNDRETRQVINRMKEMAGLPASVRVT